MPNHVQRSHLRTRIDDAFRVTTREVISKFVPVVGPNSICRPSPSPVSAVGVHEVRQYYTVSRETLGVYCVSREVSTRHSILRLYDDIAVGLGFVRQSRGSDAREVGV